jgi:O-antigen/teichoic acid export membrane protein
VSGAAGGPATRSFVYATVSAASAGLLLLLSILISNLLGQEAWGQFAFALALSMVGESLMDFGIHQVTIRSIARDRGEASRLFRNSLALKILPALVMFVALSVVAFALRREPSVRLVCVLMLGSAVFRSYLLTVRGVLQGLEHFADDSIVVVMDRLAVLVFCAVALWAGGGLVALASAFLAARALTMAGALWVVRRHVGGARLAFDTAVWKDLPRRALPLGAFLIVLNLYSYIDTLILGSLTTDLETGLYNSAYKTYEGLTYATAILSAVITPRLANLWSENRSAHLRLVRQSLVGSVGLALALTAAAWWLGPFVLPVFGTGAVAAVPTLRILALGLPFVFAIWVLHAVAISVFEERWLFRTTVAGSVVNVALNFWWIPQYGRDGAALATVAGELLSLVILVWALRQAIWPAEGRA